MEGRGIQEGASGPIQAQIDDGHSTAKQWHGILTLAHSQTPAKPSPHVMQLGEWKADKFTKQELLWCHRPESGVL